MYMYIHVLKLIFSVFQNVPSTYMWLLILQCNTIFNVSVVSSLAPPKVSATVANILAVSFCNSGIPIKLLMIAQLISCDS